MVDMVVHRHELRATLARICRLLTNRQPAMHAPLRRQPMSPLRRPDPSPYPLIAAQAGSEFFHSGPRVRGDARP